MEKPRAAMFVHPSVIGVLKVFNEKEINPEIDEQPMVAKKISCQPRIAILVSEIDYSDLCGDSDHGVDDGMNDIRTSIIVVKIPF